MSAQFEDLNSIINEYQRGQREKERNEEASSRPEPRKAEAQPNAEAIREREARVRAESERDALRAEIDASRRRDMESRGDFKGLLELERADRQREKEQSDHWVAEATRKAIDPEVRRLAKKLGLIDLGDTAHLDLKHVRVRDDGKVMGLDYAFEALQEAKPHFFRGGEKPGRRTIARPGSIEDRSGGTEDWARKSVQDFSQDMRREFGINI